MKRIHRIIALILAVLMFSLAVCASGMKVEAIDKGGAIKTDKYTVGVDLSIWNIGGSSVMDYSAVDFERMKADGCDFAILRLGFEGSSTGKDTLDLAFIEYYNRARAAGMKLGVYFFARATTYEGAKNDAEWVISVIEENNMYFEYPICYDVEADAHYAMGASALNSLCLGWCETLEANGYFPAVYLNRQIYPKLPGNFKLKYDVWYRYIKSDGEFDVQYDPATLNISDKCSLWQYTMYQRFDGCSYKYTGKNQIDGNVSYKDYEAIMAANGYNNWDAKPETPDIPDSSDVTEDSAIPQKPENGNGTIETSKEDSAQLITEPTEESLKSNVAVMPIILIVIICILGIIAIGTLIVVAIVVIVIVVRKKKKK